MTTTVDRQCRIVTVAETAADDACAVAAVRELAWGMNNYKACVSGQKLIDSTVPVLPVGGGHLNPYTVWFSTPGSTAEQLVHRFAPRFLPWGYTEIWFQISGFMVVGALGSCKWRLYASTRPYSGGLTFDISHLGPVWDVSTWIPITSTAHQVPPGMQDLEAVRNESGLVHLTLTSELTNGSEHCYLTSVNATARGAGL